MTTTRLDAQDADLFEVEVCEPAVPVTPRPCSSTATSGAAPAITSGPSSGLKTGSDERIGDGNDGHQ
ncbi:hypothetical protein ACIBI3_06950 [Actinomadura luteofluorescens]|uniref:hypothetical protein n=1 Tax=Actinomadura luteofluorescens TaxID=46163 RepID=UPI0034930796